MTKSLYVLGILLAMPTLNLATPLANPGDRSVPDIDRNHWVYASVAESPTARCFDEALWKAITNIAGIEERLPGNLETIELEIRSDNYLLEPLRLVFTRRALRWLKDGAITPERFLQDHVLFI
jgi:hypothetical protein